MPVRFRANRGNIALYWSFFNHIDFGLLQPRQTGKSVSTDVLMTGVTNIWANNTTISLITKDNGLRVKNIERLKEIRNLLPDYIYYPNRLDADNSETITNLRLNNYYKTLVGRNDRIAADKLGRGLTVPILHFDELAYILYIGISLPVALSSGSAARDEAAAAGQPYGNIYTTTAGNINTRDGQYAYQFMTKGAPWTERFFDLPDREALVKMVETHSTGLKPLIYAPFNHRQLGYDDAWLYRKLRESASEGDVADRDYLNIWTTGGEGSPLTTEQKANLKANEREPDYIEITTDGYILNWYIPQEEIASRMANGRFVCGADPSEALGEDNDASTLVIQDAYSHDVVCTGRYSNTNISNWAMFIARLLQRFPTMTFVPERKSMGTAIIDILCVQLPLMGFDPFKRIYNRIVDEQDTLKTEYQEIQRPLSQRHSYFYDKFKRYFGYNTSGGGRHSRDELYGATLNTAMQLGSKRVYDRLLTNELLSLQIRNGRIDHARGGHDDLVIAYLLGHWFCTKARHLNYYGIDATRIYSTAAVDYNSMSNHELYQIQQKQQATEEFNRLIEELKNAEDPMVISKLELKLRQLSTRLDVQSVTGVGIDAMIKQAQEERARKAKLSRYNRPQPNWRLRYNA